MAIKTLQRLHDCRYVKTEHLCQVIAEVAAEQAWNSPLYVVLATRFHFYTLSMKPLREMMRFPFSMFMGCREISPFHYHKIVTNERRLEQAIVVQGDLEFDYFGHLELERLCLLVDRDGKTERPQHMLMRVAVGIHGADIDAAIETYNFMSRKYFIHDIPTMANACISGAQLSSSYHVSVSGGRPGRIKSSLITILRTT